MSSFDRSRCAFSRSAQGKSLWPSMSGDCLCSARAVSSRAWSVDCCELSVVMGRRNRVARIVVFFSIFSVLAEPSAKLS